MKTGILDRPDYLQALHRLRDLKLIKALTGVRRSGKSTILEMFARQLEDEGVGAECIQQMNFEDLELQESGYMAMYSAIQARLVPDKKNYVFLDEIQQVHQFEKILYSLFIKDNVDLYVTGSNAFLLSGELATLLSGRYIEVHVYPLSFKESVSGDTADTSSNESYEAGEHLNRRFDAFLQRGGFPYTTAIDDETTYRDYMAGIVNTVLVKDVLSRRQRSDTNLAQELARYLTDTAGSLINPRRIANTLTSAGVKTSAETVSAYLKEFENAYLFYRCDRYDIAGRKHLPLNSKIYPVDSGLRFALLGARRPNFGAQLETAVFLELKRRGYDIYVGVLPDAEIDFVALKDGIVEYYQVSDTVRAESTYRREIAGFKAIKDNYRKIILTRDSGRYDDAGIEQINVVDWLLG